MKISQTRNRDTYLGKWRIKLLLGINLCFYCGIVSFLDFINEITIDICYNMWLSDDLTNSRVIVDESRHSTTSLPRIQSQTENLRNTCFAKYVTIFCYNLVIISNTRRPSLNRMKSSSEGLSVSWKLSWISMMS